MRESNFRSAAANRASVNITTTLYDRRALDCTSDRPLINSLNHLAYLTSSSARVRETLCFDGGLERLVAILKECCEPVGHGVDAGCDILSPAETFTDTSSASLRFQPEFSTQSDVSSPPASPASSESSASSKLPSNCSCEALVAWKWSLAFQCLLYLGTRGTESIRQRLVEAGAIPVIATILDNYLQTQGAEETECCSHHSPETPQQQQQRYGLWNQYDQRSPNSATFAPSEQGDQVHDTEVDAISSTVPSSMPGATGEVSLLGLEDTTNPATLEASVATMASGDSVAAAAPILTSVVMSRAEQFVSQQLSGVLTNGRLQSQLTAQPMSVTPPRKFKDGILIPRVEDVIWSLEILAFVSKYTYLRPLLQSTNLVPKLSCREPTSPLLLRPEFAGEHTMDVEPNRDYDTYDFENTDDLDDEFKTEHLNIFPLVEKFTAHREPIDVPYWSGIIMRNSCRKDETRGIRQCANFECARWESYPRQFAKCRRCKRTKYCSKQCQLKAWAYHRHWCSPVSASTSASSRSTAVTSVEARPQSSGQTTTTQPATTASSVGQPLAPQGLVSVQTQQTLQRMGTESQQTTPDPEPSASQVLRSQQRIQRLDNANVRLDDAAARAQSPFVWDSLDQSQAANVLTRDD